MKSREREQKRPPTDPESGGPRNGLRKRARLTSGSPAPGTDTAALELPLRLHASPSEPGVGNPPGPEPPPVPPPSPNESLTETVQELHELEETATRITTQLRETAAEIGRRIDEQVSRALRRLSDQQGSIHESERNLAYTVEQMRRENGRRQWMQAGVVGLALLAGMLGGTGAALLILAWSR